MSLKKALTTNTKVEVIEHGDPPLEVEWVRDIHVNARTRRELIKGFWKGKRGIEGQIAYVANESDRDRLRRDGKLRVLIRDPSAQCVTLIVPARLLRESR